VVRIRAGIVADVRVENAAPNAVCHAKLGDKARKVIRQIEGLPRNANGNVVRGEPEAAHADAGSGLKVR